MKPIAIDLRGTDNASRAIQAASQHLANLRGEIDRLKAKGSVDLPVADSRKLQRLTAEAVRVEKSLDKMTSTGAKGATELNSQFGGLANTLNGLGLGGLGTLATGAGIAAAVVSVGRLTAELGQLGAQSLDTKQSFESVTRSVGSSPALLNQLTKAAGGTITELRLMQLTNTALAGASAEMGAAFANAVPKLIEGARAANKLNPALGDTEFLFQSLVTGIKRGSPMLIDNTGITLKLGEANEAYARSLGKTADALTEEEKKLALLNATMDGVDRLVQQAGGNLDGMTSKLQQMTTASADLKTALGELVAEPYTVVVQTITKGLTGTIGSIKFADEVQTAQDPTAATNARIAAVQREIEVLREMQRVAADTANARGQSDFFAAPAAAYDQQIAKLEQLVADFRQYGDATDYVRAKQDAYYAAVARTAEAQDRYNAELAAGIPGEAELARTTLEAAKAQEAYAQQALESAKAASAWSDVGVGAAKRVTSAAGAAADAVKGVGEAAANSGPYWDAMATFAEKAARRASDAAWAARSAMGQMAFQGTTTGTFTEPSKTRWGLYGDWARNFTEQPTSQDPVQAWLKRQEAANKTAADNWASEYERAAQAAQSTIGGYLSQGQSISIGLKDMRGDPFAAGSNGPFEAIYRAQALADGINGDQEAQWAQMYGLTPETAKKIAADFQAGLFSPEVMGLIDTDALVQQAKIADMAEKSKTEFVKQIAKQAGTGTNVVSALFGFETKVEGAAGGGSQAQAGVDTAMGKIADSIGTSVAGRDFAGRIIGFGEKTWGYFEQGFVDKAKDSSALLAAVDGMVAKALAGRTGGSVAGSSRASGVVGV